MNYSWHLDCTARPGVFLHSLTGQGVFFMLCYTVEEKNQAPQFFEIGLGLLHTEHYRDAIDMLSIAISLDAGFAEAYQYRGLAHYSLGTYQEALDDYTTALSLDPLLDNIHYFRGMARLQLKHYEDAIYDFTAAIELKDYFAEAYYQRSVCKGFLKDYRGAICDMRSAAQLGMRLAQKILNDNKVVW
jgi:tetratricopeptide (TPR) repeat protein